MYHHDPRHVDVLVKDLGLEHGNSVQTPAAPDAMEEEESELLSQDQHHRYKSLVARCLFFSQDRADITFIVNELCQKMSNPNQQSSARLKRLARCLKRERQWGQLFEYGELTEELTVFTETRTGLDAKRLESRRLQHTRENRKSSQKAAQRQNCTQQHWERQKQWESRA